MISCGGANRRLGGFGSPGDYATFKFPPTPRHDLHGFLWAQKFASGRLFSDDPHANKALSKRDNILNASKADWMEWQAGYISGAMLMPASPLRRAVSDYCAARNLHASIHHQSEHAAQFAQMVMERFAVSEEAARIRLLKLNLITTTVGQTSLFG